MVSDKCRIGEGSRPSPSPLPPKAGANATGGEAGSAGEGRSASSPALPYNPPPAGEGFRCETEPGRAAGPPPRLPRLRRGGICRRGGRTGRGRAGPPLLPSSVPPPLPQGGFFHRNSPTGEGYRPSPSPLPPPAGQNPAGGDRIGRRGPILLSLSHSLPLSLSQYERQGRWLTCGGGDRRQAATGGSKVARWLAPSGFLSRSAEDEDRSR